MIFEIANTVIAVSVVGALISLAFLLPEFNGDLTEVADKTKKFLLNASIVWVFTSMGNFIATLAQILDSAISEVIRVNVIRSFATQITLGKLLIFQIVTALLVAFFARRLKKNGGAVWLLIVAISGIVAPVSESFGTPLHNAIEIFAGFEKLDPRKRW